MAPPLPNIPSCRTEYYDPPKYEDFNWFQPPKCKKRPAKTNKQESLTTVPLPTISPAARYPYRYTSAGPSTYGRTQKERDIHQCVRDVKINSNMTGDKGILHSLENVEQLEGYETETLTQMLKPFTRHKVNFPDIHHPDLQGKKSRRIPVGLLETLHAPYKAHSEFDKLVMDFLHPDWGKDPKYKRRLHYRMQHRSLSSRPAWVEELEDPPGKLDQQRKKFRDKSKPKIPKVPKI